MPMTAATVAAVLLPLERSRVEAAGQGCFRVVHGGSVEEAIREVRRAPVNAVFLSVHRCEDADLPRVARFVREFPHVPAVALLSRADQQSHERVLRLGASGVHEVVDVSVPSGWHRLRTLLREPSTPVAAQVLAALDRDLREAPPDCWHFFEVVVRRAPDLRTAQALARILGVVPGTLMSRFCRAELPSPKAYLAFSRLLHAAYLFRAGGHSIADVSHRLDYSSPQSFGRHLREFLGVTAGEFRRRMSFDLVLRLFLERLIAPHRDRLLAFHPFGTWPGDHGQTAA
jgi:AraC-like DNA-binding protein